MNILIFKHIGLYKIKLLKLLLIGVHGNWESGCHIQSIASTLKIIPQNQSLINTANVNTCATHTNTTKYLYTCNKHRKSNVTNRAVHEYSCGQITDSI